MVSYPVYIHYPNAKKKHHCFIILGEEKLANHASHVKYSLILYVKADHITGKWIPIATDFDQSVCWLVCSMSNPITTLSESEVTKLVIDHVSLNMSHEDQTTFVEQGRIGRSLVVASKWREIVRAQTI